MRVVAHRVGEDEPAAGSDTFAQGGHRVEGGLRPARLLVPAHVLERGYSDHQLELAQVAQVERVAVQDAGRTLVLVDDEVPLGAVVGEDVPDLEHPAARAIDDSLHHWDLHSALGEPGGLVAVGKGRGLPTVPPKNGPRGAGGAPGGPG